MLFDLRLAWRSLMAQRGLAVAIVLTVGLAVAANTALFSVLDGLLFRPLPFADADRLVHVELKSTAQPSIDERARLASTFVSTSQLSGSARAEPTTLFEEGAGADWRLKAVNTTPGYFELFGVLPTLGRTFVAADVGTRPFSIAISDALWRARFGADETIVDRVVELPGAINSSWRFRIVGVMPAGFEFPAGTNVWRASGRAGNVLPTYAKLSPGATVEQLRAQFPELSIAPLREYVRPGGTRTLAFLLGATALLLVVAWVQVAALLFARAAGRAKEIGIRLALGAGRGRLVRQFAAEGLIVAIGALGLAWTLASALTTFIVRLLPTEMTFGQYLAPDVRAFGFSCLIATTSVLVFTWMPFEIVRRITPASLLRGAAIGALRASAVRTRAGMLVAQLALTAMLLYVAGLAFHSFARVNAVNLGFNPNNLIAVLMPQGGGVPPGLTREQIDAFLTHRAEAFNNIAGAIRGVRGVVSAAEAGTPPFCKDITMRDVVPAAPGAAPMPSQINSVAPEYFATIGTPLLEGRPATLEEARQRLSGKLATPSVVVVNARLAGQLRRLGPVIGQLIHVQDQDQAALVIGVAANYVDERPDREPDPQVFFFTATGAKFVVARLDPDHPAPIAELQTAMRAVWPALPEWQIIRLTDEAREATADYRARTILLALIGALCLPLALAGLIGALTHATTQRTREIAIRLALGAERAHIARRVVLQAVVIVGVGLLAGLLAGLGVGRLMSSFLFQVDPLDVASIAGVAAALLVVGCLSALLPARRASRIEPALALRES